MGCLARLSSWRPWRQGTTGGRRPPAVKLQAPVSTCLRPGSCSNRGRGSWGWAQHTSMACRSVRGKRALPELGPVLHGLHRCAHCEPGALCACCATPCSRCSKAGPGFQPPALPLPPPHAPRSPCCAQKQSPSVAAFRAATLAPLSMRRCHQQGAAGPPLPQPRGPNLTLPAVCQRRLCDHHGRRPLTPPQVHPRHD